MVEAHCLQIQWVGIEAPLGRHTYLTLHLTSANFDVTKGTLLEYELHPEQFIEVTMAIFSMDQGKLLSSILCLCVPIWPSPIVL